MTAVLGGDTYYRIAKGNGDDDLLQRWMAGMHPETRRAFVAALLLVDGKATLRQVIVGWEKLPRRIANPAEVAADELENLPPLIVVHRLCLHCGQPLDPPAPGMVGRPSSYHEKCVRPAAALRRAERRRAVLQSARPSVNGTGDLPLVD